MLSCPKCKGEVFVVDAMNNSATCANYRCGIVIELSKPFTGKLNEIPQLDWTVHGISRDEEQKRARFLARALSDAFAWRHTHHAEKLSEITQILEQLSVGEGWR